MNIGITLIVSIAATLIAGFVFFYLRGKEGAYQNRHFRQLGLLLSALSLLIAIGCTVGSVINFNQLQPVKIYSNRVEAGFGTLPYEQIRYVYLHKGEQRSFVSPDIAIDTTFLAYFEKKEGKSYVLSEDNYDVKAIVSAIRPLLDPLIAK